MEGVLAAITIEGLWPTTPSGLPAKGAVGQAVGASLVAYVEGHEVLTGELRWRALGSPTWQVEPLVREEHDCWSSAFVPKEVGMHEFAPVLWRDRWAGWLAGATAKLGAAQDISVELEDGARLIDERLRAKAPRGRTKRTRDDALSGMVGVVDALRDVNAEQAVRLAAAARADVALAMAGPLRQSDAASGPRTQIWIDRPIAAAAAWYELFPRSEGGLRAAAERLPAIAALGFDVVYLPPISPIGHTHRKGRGGTLTPAPDDPGSPWAIGADGGGHTAIHADLGTLDDFAHLVRRAEELDLEIALDIAFQCSPDHPWVAQHPEWFTTRSDGSIAYAENPPKKYQDIHPINFWPAEDRDRAALWAACIEVFETWIARGVFIFRVDNPHTKPIAFWEHAISQIRARHPEVVFLSEAFTRPPVMAKLAEVGFSQSYTYFTWRTTKWELETYLDEVSNGPRSAYLRPSFWPTTPDILSGPLRDGPLSAFALRIVLAATMVPSYGIYSGYELGENQPASPDNEEYADSEKYRIVRRDWSQPAPLDGLLRSLNRTRRAHAALVRLGGAVIHGTDSDHLIAYSRRSADGADCVLTVVNLDPYEEASGSLHLDLGALGLTDGEQFDAHDELSGETFTWHDANPWVRLHPAERVAHVLWIRRL